MATKDELPIFYPPAPTAAAASAAALDSVSDAWARLLQETLASPLAAAVPPPTASVVASPGTPAAAVTGAAAALPRLAPASPSLLSWLSAPPDDLPAMAAAAEAAVAAVASTPPPPAAGLPPTASVQAVLSAAGEGLPSLSAGMVKSGSPCTSSCSTTASMGARVGCGGAAPRSRVATAWEDGNARGGGGGSAPADAAPAGRPAKRPRRADGAPPPPPAGAADEDVAAAAAPKIRQHKNAAPSRYCHVCARATDSATAAAAAATLSAADGSAPSTTFVTCKNIAYGVCRKTTCAACFVGHGWDWAAARGAGGYVCTHCRKACPPGASCATYARTNRRRRAVGVERRRAIEAALASGGDVGALLGGGAPSAN